MHAYVVLYPAVCVWGDSCTCARPNAEVRGVFVCVFTRTDDKSNNVQYGDGTVVLTDGVRYADNALVADLWTHRGVDRTARCRRCVCCMWVCGVCTFAWTY